MTVLRNLGRNYVPRPSYAIQSEKTSLDPVHDIPSAPSTDDETYGGV